MQLRWAIGVAIVMMAITQAIVQVTGNDAIWGLTGIIATLIAIVVYYKTTRDDTWHGGAILALCSWVGLIMAVDADWLELLAILIVAAIAFGIGALLGRWLHK